ncbi:hypothetical protein MRB53_010203 [Persea americana]|uniref:Uncharacterized protein n=1 Tax=Persea americana TaxID=3435 RepID=A0ACC2LR35_PERAE|nr:hypothetical protein MRB53_010203 [Persea americana]
MCFKRLCGKERLARASMSLKTKTRASGSSFVTVGGSVKLDAERLARASMSLKTKTRASGSSFVTVGGSMKLDAADNHILWYFVARFASKCVSSDCVVSKRLARASMSLKTKTRASGSSFVTVGGSVKLDAERLARASMSLKTKTRASGSSFVTVGGSVKLDAAILISHKSLFGYALCRDV